MVAADNFSSAGIRRLRMGPFSCEGWPGIQPVTPVRTGVLACEDAGPGQRADGAGGVGAGEAGVLGSRPVDVGSLEVAAAEFVGKDEVDIEGD